MKHIIKIIYLIFIINSSQILATDYSIDVKRVHSELRDRFGPAGTSTSFNNIAQFYRNRNYMPAWVEGSGISRAGEHALYTFENAGKEGLDPSDYAKAVKAVDAIENSPERAIDAEIAITRAALQYIDDVNGNRVNSRRMANELYAKKNVVSAPRVLAENMNADPTGAWLESYTFDNPHYQALKAFLAEYRQNLQSSFYRDRDTARKIHQIVINMERWRWLPEKMPTRYAIINIAAFDLKCVENDKVVLEMPVVIGKHGRKTPVFESTVDSIRFNPSWHLPHHIAVEDSLPKIQANPDYFNFRKYILYNSAGQVISPYSVNWANVNASNFNYTLRQIPGDHNSLGKIRFGLTNSKNIFMHHTSESELEYFDEPVRAFSSGCIRLKHPDQFAFFLFNDSLSWPLSKIRENMIGTITKNVPLDRQLPVYITYFTVWPDENGQMQFATDVYDRDDQLISAFRYPVDARPSRNELVLPRKIVSAFESEPNPSDSSQSEPSSSDSYAADPYASDPYAADPYAADPYASDPYQPAQYPAVY
jgi:murein L,D-transpeptidase YcbB/YkuD